MFKKMTFFSWPRDLTKQLLFPGDQVSVFSLLGGASPAGDKWERILSSAMEEPWQPRRGHIENSGQLGEMHAVTCAVFQVNRAPKKIENPNRNLLKPVPKIKILVGSCYRYSLEIAISIGAVAVKLGGSLLSDFQTNQHRIHHGFRADDGQQGDID